MKTAAYPGFGNWRPDQGVLISESGALIENVQYAALPTSGEDGMVRHW